MNGFANTVKLEPGHDRGVTILIALTAVLTAMPVMALNVAIGLQLVLLCAVGLVCVTAYFEHSRRTARRSILQATVDRTGNWRLRRRMDREPVAAVLAAQWVSGRLIVLRFRLGSWRHATLIMTRQSLPAGLWRPLRARLRRF